MDVDEAVTVTEGVMPTLTAVVAPVADGHPLLTAYTEYTPAAAGCALAIVGFCRVDE
jgi:hypothetical protein